ncbi:uncharacterized protein LOC120355476 isoform X2 [Nilaparvata lugens]|uniref:uncharacterized protein LOC120355476 isoform X2 n=1 Tax=Nilaparvata lugens TaxID=108931 RepID=UPI00193E3A4F|nr:uncharacterized protein LOC120355476 isoform X2 [Nilaparvata lugens]
MTEAEDVTGSVVKTCVAAGVNVTAEAIDICHRLKGRVNAPPPIVVKFVRRTHTHAMLGARRQVKGFSTTHIGIQGRKMKGKKYQYMMMRMLMGLKIFIIGLVLPAVIGMALLASWKGMTISLMALLMASIIGMKNLISAATKHEGSHHILVTSIPSQQHQHWWRKSENPEITSWDNPHDLVYRGHR